MKDAVLDNLEQTLQPNNRIPKLQKWIKVVMVALFGILISDIYTFKMYYNYYYFENHYITNFGDNLGLFPIISGLLNLILIIAVLVSGIVFVQWFSRLYTNLSYLHLSKLKFSAKVSAWCWFVPVVNFFLPYLITKDLIDQTENLAQEVSETRVIGNISKQLVVAWWVSYVIATLVPLFIFTWQVVETFKPLYRKSDIFTNLMMQQIYAGVGHFFYFIAGLILLVILKQIYPLEQLIYQRQSDL